MIIIKLTQLRVKTFKYKIMRHTFTNSKYTWLDKRDKIKVNSYLKVPDFMGRNIITTSRKGYYVNRYLSHVKLV